MLAEPVTEGRLAASLARDGEGPCALYLAPFEGLEAWVAAARERGIAVSPVRSGPLGRSVLVTGTPPGSGHPPVMAPDRPSGPHLVVVEELTAASSPVSGGTIAP